MKLKFAAILLFLLPAAASAQSIESVDACRSLRQEITAAGEEARGLEKLLVGDLTEETYLSQLYDGVKILSKSGEMFFKAADSHESACKEALTAAEKGAEVRSIYDWYLEPVRAARQFFHRAREAAVKLNRQDDVDAFQASIREYDAAVMKLVGVCESDLEGKPEAASCKDLSAKLGDVLK